MLILAVFFLSSCALGVPVAEDGGLDMSKFSTFTSSESNLNGDTHQDSYVQEGAEMNGMPTFGLNGELHSENDDVLEDWDVLVPEDNIHVHSSRENEDESTMVEPLNYLDSLGGSGDVLDYMDYNEANDFNYPNSVESVDYNDDDDDED